jgi:hypothetical protein
MGRDRITVKEENANSTSTSELKKTLACGFVILRTKK